MTTYEVTHDESKGRFEIRVDGHLAYEQYERREGVIDYRHTEVPDALGGRGVGSFLVAYVLDYARSNGLKVAPSCPFVRGYIDRHPEYRSISLAHDASA
ncbi:MAG: GNAT family N-acetyltransferase [Burkholderiaceae bacterium]